MASGPKTDESQLQYLTQLFDVKRSEAQILEAEVKRLKEVCREKADSGEDISLTDTDKENFLQKDLEKNNELDIEEKQLGEEDLDSRYEAYDDNNDVYMSHIKANDPIYPLPTESEDLVGESARRWLNAYVIGFIFGRGGLISPTDATDYSVLAMTPSVGDSMLTRFATLCTSIFKPVPLIDKKPFIEEIRITIHPTPDRGEEKDILVSVLRTDVASAFNEMAKGFYKSSGEKRIPAIGDLDDFLDEHIDDRALAYICMQIAEGWEGQDDCIVLDMGLGLLGVFSEQDVSNFRDFLLHKFQVHSTMVLSMGSSWLLYIDNINNRKLNRLIRRHIYHPYWTKMMDGFFGTVDNTNYSSILRTTKFTD